MRKLNYLIFLSFIFSFARVSYGMNDITNETRAATLAFELEQRWKYHCIVNNIIDNELTQAISRAINEGNLNSLTLLIDNPTVDINALYGFGFSALQEAAREGHLEIVELLIKNGADLEKQDNLGRTALHYAVLNNNIKIIKLLLDKGAFINAQDQGSSSPLHVAATYGYLQAAEILLDRGASVTLKDFSGYTPFYQTVCGGKHNKRVVGLFLDRGIFTPGWDNLGVRNSKTRQKNILQALDKENLADIFKYLEDGAYPNSQVRAYIDRKRLELFNAIAQDNEEQVKALLLQGFTLNTCDSMGNTLLHKAILSESVQVTKLFIHLLYKTVKLNSYLEKQNIQGNTPLQIAALYASTTILPLFVRAKKEL